MRIIKAKDRTISQGEMVLNWLIEDKARQAIAFDPDGGRVKINISLQANGYDYPVTVYRDGFILDVFHGLILNRIEAVAFLNSTLAEIPRPPRSSPDTLFRRIVTNTRAELKNRHTSELRAFMA